MEHGTSKTGGAMPPTLWKPWIVYRVLLELHSPAGTASPGFCGYLPEIMDVPMSFLESVK